MIPSSSKPPVLHLQNSLSFPLPSYMVASLALTFLFLSYKVFVMKLGLLRQSKMVPHLKLLNLITFENSVLPCHVDIWGVIILSTWAVKPVTSKGSYWLEHSHSKNKQLYLGPLVGTSSVSKNKTNEIMSMVLPRKRLDFSCLWVNSHL